MLYIGRQYQAIKKVKKKESRPTLPKLFTGRNRKHTYFCCLRYNIKVLIISNKNHNKLTITVSLVL